MPRWKNKKLGKQAIQRNKKSALQNAASAASDGKSSENSAGTTGKQKNTAPCGLAHGTKPFNDFRKNTKNF